MPEEVVKVNIRGKIKSMKDFCDIIQGIVDRTEIEWLELDNGVLRYQPISDVPPSGNGPIQALKKHLMDLGKWLAADPMRLFIKMSVKSPGEATLVLWLPNLRDSQR